jgi:predicted ATP-dependent endonuclease of OLD family
MKIDKIHIFNFRKLKDAKIELSKEKTLFVGANNSGKTSAMDALRKFLIKSDGNNFIYNDLFVVNRSYIKEIGVAWTEDNAQKPTNLSDWMKIVPSMDVWLNVKDDEFHYVAHIIPTLDWTGGILGVRLSFLPKDIGKLFDDYRSEYNRARQTENGGEKKLYPVTLCEFLERSLVKYFEIKPFILDPQNANDSQDADFTTECDNKRPFDGLIKIDMIDAQRGLADVDSSNDVVSLSRQFRAYYDKHLDIDKATAPEDLETLTALETATASFNKTLKAKFSEALNELGELGYPGITDPKISIEAKIKEKTAFEHDSAVQYDLSDTDDSFKLPEKFNGLGYQNLISIVFKLISFRDDRIHKGKAGSDDDSKQIAPLHLVLLEEPEAHLHIQVQQVLIKKAYEVLTALNVEQKDKYSWLSTQLVVSTHSSHIAKEVDFSNIRYFKRLPADSDCKVSTSLIINLSGTFGSDAQTEKFVQRYIQVTHCDLFFADAIILVEGTAENVLLPHFIKNDFIELDSRYLSILPVGGRHSHRFKPLINKLGIPTLIITDIDSAESGEHHKSAQPKRNADLVSGNASIAKWGVQKTDLDSLLNLAECSKVFDNNIRIAYQTPITVSLSTSSVDTLSSTFEESVIYSNYAGILNLNGNGIVKSVKEANEKTDSNEFCAIIYNAVHKSAGEKVSFAIELMYELDKVNTPNYISEGLTWIQVQLDRADERAGQEEVLDSE